MGAHVSAVGVLTPKNFGGDCPLMAASLNLPPVLEADDARIVYSEELVVQTIPVPPPPIADLSQAAVRLLQ